MINTFHCCESLSFLKELPDCSIDCVVSDPPYNVSSNAKITMVGVHVVKAQFGEWDHWSWKEYDQFLIDHLEQFYRVLKDGANCLLWLDRAYSGIAWRFAEQIGFSPKNIIAAIKGNALPHIRKSNLRSGWEACLWVSKGKPKVFNFGTQIEMNNAMEYQVSQEEIEEASLIRYMIGMNKVTDHPCEKYRDQIAPLIKWFTNPGDLVLDCFCGTGIIPVVCKEMNRDFIAVDKDENWVRQAKIRVAKTPTPLF